MFKKVLIANRGAIACRVIRTLKNLGIQSVAVYSEADRDSLHVTLADEAVFIGDSPASQSYLNIEKILQVAKEAGAEAIHPGYGFLSENAEFCDLCESQGIVFLGPNSAQMRSFGLKHTARELAIQANVPLLPGSQLLADEAEALVEANRIGYPLMLKSTAGGGGIGMRLVWNEAELKDAYATVSYLAQANFKDAVRNQHDEIHLCLNFNIFTWRRYSIVKLEMPISAHRNIHKEVNIRPNMTDI
jgi:urea carboxylase